MELLLNYRDVMLKVLRNFFTSYGNAQEEVDKGDEEETMDKNLKKMGEDEFINKFLKEDKNEEVKNKEEVKKEIKKKLKEVLDVIDKGLKWETF